MIEIILIFLLIGIVVLAFRYDRLRWKKEKSKISLKESMDLAKIPIVTFQEGDRNLNFLVDSGSSESHISKKAAKEILGTPINVSYNYIGSTGSADNISKMIEAVLRYKNETFKVNLIVNENLDGSFEEVKKDCGVQLHGILGSDFLKNHKYILDFAELVAYHK